MLLTIPHGFPGIPREHITVYTLIARVVSTRRLAQGERSPAFREFINAAGLEMKSVDEHIESIGARGEDCESHGWARHAPAGPKK